ncbi:DNA repair protein RecO [Bacillota bacterium LX-D]|nr:DNA repair protein RecO [Bacillota bacterium LX-D]
MRLCQVEAFVLNAKNFREADKIVTLFTKEQGKISALAKGIRKIKSKNRGALQPFSCSKVMLYKGQERNIITQCELIEGFPGLRKDLEHLSAASYQMELVQLLLPEEEKNQQVYILLSIALQLLVYEDLELVTRFFEVKLLNILGYQPELDACVLCGQPIQMGINTFSAAEGGLLCSSCQYNQSQCKKLNGSTLAIWKQLQKINPRHLNRLKISSNDRIILKETLADYLEFLLERKLKAAGFMSKLKSI